MPSEMKIRAAGQFSGRPESPQNGATPLRQPLPELDATTFNAREKALLSLLVEQRNSFAALESARRGSKRF